MEIRVKYQARIDGYYSVIAEEDLAGFKKGQIIDIVNNSSTFKTYDISKKHAQQTKIYYPGSGQISLFELLDKFPPVKRHLGTRTIEDKKKAGRGFAKVYYRYILELSDKGRITVSKRIYDMFKHLKTEQFMYR